MDIKYFRLAILISFLLIFTFPQYTICLGDTQPLKDLLLVADKINDPILKFNALVEISIAFREIKEPTLAESTLLEASNIINNTQNSTLKNIFISTLIDNYIELGEIDKALGIVKHIDFTDSRDEALLKIIVAYIQCGQYEKAINLSKDIKELFSKTILFDRIIGQLDKQRTYAEFLEVQDIIKKSPSQVQRLFKRIHSEKHYRKNETPILDLFTSDYNSHLIKAMLSFSGRSISLKKYKEAERMLNRSMELSKRMKSDYSRDNSLTQIGLTFVELGDLKGAEGIADTIRIPMCLSKLQVAIASAYVKAGAFEEAIILTNKIDVVYQKNKALIQIIMQQIDSGKEKEANRLIDSINDTPSAPYVYCALADYYIENKEYDNMVKIYAKIDDRFTRFRILINMAKEIEKDKNIRPAGQAAFKRIAGSFNQEAYSGW